MSNKERNKIAKLLEKPLSNEFLSTRLGFNGVKITYIEGWLIISIANHIFGYDGWSSEIKNITQEYLDVKNDKIFVGYTSTCRITLKDRTFREDIGFGSAENVKNKGLAIEKAKKQAITDSIKRALRQFGNSLGNCCYDKEFLKNINKDKENLLKKSDLKALKNTFDDYSFDSSSNKK